MLRFFRVVVSPYPLWMVVSPCPKASGESKVATILPHPKARAAFSVIATVSTLRRRRLARDQCLLRVKYSTHDCSAAGVGLMEGPPLIRNSIRMESAPKFLSIVSRQRRNLRSNETRAFSRNSRPSQLATQDADGYDFVAFLPLPRACDALPGRNTRASPRLISLLLGFPPQRPS